MAYLERYLITKKSQLPKAGKGLFTTVDIPKDTRIVEYKGKIEKWKDVKHLDGINGYLMFMNRNVIINAEPARHTLGRYANDARGLSRIPALRNNATYVSDGNRCFIEATRRIKAGEEILVYYGAAYWRLMRKLGKMTKVISHNKRSK